MLNEKIKKLRLEAKLTQAQLGEKINVTRQAVAKWEKGEAYPSDEKIKALADYFKITCESLTNDSMKIKKRFPLKIILVSVISLLLLIIIFLGTMQLIYVSKMNTYRKNYGYYITNEIEALEIGELEQKKIPYAYNAEGEIFSNISENNTTIYLKKTTQYYLFSLIYENEKFLPIYERTIDCYSEFTFDNICYSFEFVDEVDKIEVLAYDSTSNIISMSDIYDSTSPIIMFDSKEASYYLVKTYLNNETLNSYLFSKNCSLFFIFSSSEYNSIELSFVI